MYGEQESVLLVEYCLAKNCWTCWSEWAGALWWICHWMDSHFSTALRRCLKACK